MERFPASQDGFLSGYACCKCSQPIKLDPSVLDAAPYDEAAAILEHKRPHPYNATGLPPRAPTAEKVSTPDSLRTERKLSAIKSAIPIQDSFVMLSKSQVSVLQHQSTGSRGDEPQNRSSISHRLKTAGKLFDLLSEATDVDHPLCEDCADELMMRLEKRVHESRKEKQAYEAYFETLMDSDEADGSTVTEEDVAKAKEEELAALETLKDLKTQEMGLKDELQAVQAELAELESLKLSYWQEVNEFQNELQVYKNEHESIVLSHATISEQLDALKKTNVYNDAFRIRHEDVIGSINGFRLGRLPSQPVDWTEINAGMGQALLLLDTLANKIKFTFQGYKLVPMGSLSRLEKTDGDKGILELHGSGELMKGMLFWNRRFDSGLVAFLNCVQQIGDYAEQEDSKYRLPNRINKDKIGDLSIKMQFNQDEAWTKALKYMLMDLKWILAFCCTRP